MPSPQTSSLVRLCLCFPKWAEFQLEPRSGDEVGAPLEFPETRGGGGGEEDRMNRVRDTHFQGHFLSTLSNTRQLP